MNEKLETNGTEAFQKGWEEARLCAKLLREGKAHIMIVTRKDGSTYRYTRPKCGR